MARTVQQGPPVTLHLGGRARSVALRAPRCSWRCLHEQLIGDRSRGRTLVAGTQQGSWS